MECVGPHDDRESPEIRNAAETREFAPPPAALKEVHDVCGLPRTCRADASALPVSSRRRPWSPRRRRTGGTSGFVSRPVQSAPLARPAEHHSLRREQAFQWTSRRSSLVAQASPRRPVSVSRLQLTRGTPGVASGAHTAAVSLRGECPCPGRRGSAGMRLPR